jgi:hypothetical protein
VRPRGRVEISPEPSPDERAAIEAALAELAEEGQPLSAWWQAGVDGAADDEDEFPRTSPGL